MPKLLDKIQTNLPLSEDQASYFTYFEVVGSSSHLEKTDPFDIDLLIVFNEKYNGYKTINFLQEWIYKLCKNYSFPIISDNFFLPLILGSSNSSEILHLILFYSLESFSLSPYSTLLKPMFSYNSDRDLSVERISQIMAIQDILKFWCMHKFNQLSDQQRMSLLKLQDRTVKKWLEPITSIHDSFTKQIILAIRESKYET